MNKSYIKKQTGIDVTKKGNVYSVPGVTVTNYDENRALTTLFGLWWNGQKERVFERDGFKCVKCGNKSSLSVDHIVNRSQGGTSLMDNLQTMCMNCHDDKTNNRS